MGKIKNDILRHVMFGNQAIKERRIEITDPAIDTCKYLGKWTNYTCDKSEKCEISDHDHNSLVPMKNKTL